MTGVEINQHMCDVAAETISRNGFAHCCSVINKDARNLTEQSDQGSSADLAEKADLCIFEVSQFL